MIDFKCPTCQQQLQAQDDIAGAKVRCPKCSQKLLIPSPPKPPSLNKTALGQPLSLNKTILGGSEPVVGSSYSITPAAAAATGSGLRAGTGAADGTPSINYPRSKGWHYLSSPWLLPALLTCLGIGLALGVGISQFAVFKQGLNREENLLASSNEAERDKQLGLEAERKPREEERLALIRQKEAEIQKRLREKEAEAAKERAEREAQQATARAERKAQAARERTERQALEAESQTKHQRIRREDLEAKKLLRAALLLDQRGGLDDRARQQLKEVIDKYPETQAAVEAKNKLDEKAKREGEAKKRAERQAQEAERRTKQERIGREDTEAKKLLRAALLLDMRSGLDDEVRKRLREIIEKYPDTPSAAQAAEKLKEPDGKARREEKAKNDEKTRFDPGQLQRTANRLIEERLRADETELRKQLLKVPELRLVNDLDVQALHKRADRKSATTGLHQALVNAGIQAGLPLRGGAQARLQPSAALVVEELSKSLRDLGFVSGVPSPGSGRSLPASQENKPLDKVAEFQKWCDEKQIEKANAALPTLLQMLQVEEPPLRLLLVRELAKVKNRDTTIVLTQRALFDLDPEVRALAVKSLEGRSSNQYLPFLLNALRYPWPPVADHAALALRKLKTTGIEPQLLDMLEKPIPSVPVLDKKTKKLLMPELVRLNHMRNCLLCHAPSTDPKDGLVRGLVPTPGQPLPRVYYAGQSGNFVRADTTFLRQDFSIIMTVEGAKPWPEQQRFDFAVRIRAVKPDEMPEVASKADNNYPQREAVLYALRGLTGKDAGESAEKWREMLGIAKENTESNASRNRSP